ncbi:MAG: hypothetical protein AAGA44_10090 [Pseudomonadota bacterium]
MIPRHKPEPVPLVVQGRRLHCVVCGNDHFRHRRVPLNSPLRSLLKLDWLNNTGQIAVCEKCGYVHTFIPWDLDN